MFRFNAGGRGTGAPMPADLDGHADRVLDELARLAVPLPETREAFRARLRIYAQFRDDRDGALGDPDEIRAALTHAGFAVRDWCESGVRPASAQAPVRGTSKRRFIAVAEPC